MRTKSPRRGSFVLRYSHFKVELPHPPRLQSIAYIKVRGADPEVSPQALASELKDGRKYHFGRCRARCVGVRLDDSDNTVDDRRTATASCGE